MAQKRDRVRELAGLMAVEVLREEGQRRVTRRRRKTSGEVIISLALIFLSLLFYQVMETYYW